MPAVQAAKFHAFQDPARAQRYIHRRNQRILRVVKIALVAILSVAMALLQTPIFVTGFFVGIAFKPQVKEALKRVTDLFKQRTGAAIGTSILASIIAFPIVFLAAGFGTGAYLGVHFPTHQKKQKPKPINRRPIHDHSGG